MWNVALDPTVNGGKYVTSTVLSDPGMKTYTMFIAKMPDRKGHVACDPKARNLHRRDQRSEMNPEEKDARLLEISSGCGNKCFPRV